MAFMEQYGFSINNNNKIQYKNVLDYFYLIVYRLTNISMFILDATADDYNIKDKFLLTLVFISLFP